VSKDVHGVEKVIAPSVKRHKVSTVASYGYGMI
jgi:hypothetical protein